MVDLCQLICMRTLFMDFLGKMPLVDLEGCSISVTRL